jgi:hypothetical protein
MKKEGEQLAKSDKSIISIGKPLEVGLMAATGGASGPVEIALAGLTKAAAREGLVKLGIEGAQAAAARSAIGRATSKTTIELVKRGEELIVRLARPGRDGHQVIESVIGADGTKAVVQKAFDAAGRLVHFDPK